MKMHQNNKLKMARATLGCIKDDANAPLWAGIIGIEETTETLEQKIGAILSRAIKQKARTGFTAQKKAAFTAMTNTGFSVCSGLKALASATSNAQLLAQSDFSRSDLRQGREVDVVNRCESISALGTENAVLLAAKYHVEAGDLTALSDAITAFKAVQTKPRQGRAASASATTDLVTLFAELDVVLNEQLDPLMAKFRFTQPTFFSEYQTARVIEDSAATHGEEEEPEPLAQAA